MPRKKVLCPLLFGGSALGALSSVSVLLVPPWAELAMDLKGLRVGVFRFMWLVGVGNVSKRFKSFLA